jgi:hypothetical protein
MYNNLYIHFAIFIGLIFFIQLFQWRLSRQKKSTYQFSLDTAFHDYNDIMRLISECKRIDQVESLISVCDSFFDKHFHTTDSHVLKKYYKEILAFISKKTQEIKHEISEEV